MHGATVGKYSSPAPDKSPPLEGSRSPARVVEGGGGGGSESWWWRLRFDDLPIC